MSEQEVFDFFPPLHSSPGKMLDLLFSEFLGCPGGVKGWKKGSGFSGSPTRKLQVVRGHTKRLGMVVVGVVGQVKEFIMPSE